MRKRTIVVTAFLAGACMPSSTTHSALRSAENETAAETQFENVLSAAIATRKRNIGKFDSMYTDGDIHIGGDVAPCLAGDEEL